MSRPCSVFHDPITYPAGQDKQSGWCHYCWLASNREEYRKGWDGEGEPEPVPIAEIKEPNLLQKLGNFITATVEWFASGGERVSEEERAARLAVCKDGCPYYKENTCKKCGCGLPDAKTFFDKLGWKTSKCPIGRWK